MVDMSVSASEIARVISECTDELFDHHKDGLPSLKRPGKYAMTDEDIEGWVQRTALAVSVLVDKLAREEEAGR